MDSIVRATRFYLLLLIACRLAEVTQGAAIGQFLPASDPFCLLFAVLALETAFRERAVPSAERYSQSAREPRRR